MTDATATLDRPMAGDKPKTLSVKLRIDVVELARLVAVYEGEQMTDLLSDILEPILEKRERDGRARRNALDAKKGKDKVE